MPRVDIFIRVRNDSGEDNGHATFSLEPQLINELSRHFTPEHLAAYFGDLIRVQCMQVLYRVPSLPQDGISPVRTWGAAWEGLGDHGSDGIRDSLVQQLRNMADEYAMRPVDPNEMIPSPHSVPDQEFTRVLRQLYANGVSDPPMDQGEFVAETPEQFAERIGATVQAVENNEARARFISDLNSRGAISDRTTAELIGIGPRAPAPTAEEIQQALQEQQDPIRGRQRLGVMLDDAAHFGLNTEFPISDIAIPQDPERRREMREAFRRSFLGGGVGSHPPNPRQVQQQEFLRGVQGQLTSGIEPVSPFTGRRRRRNQEDTQTTPETNEDRSNIPTRYQRKPVI